MLECGALGPALPLTSAVGIWGVGGQGQEYGPGTTVVFSAPWTDSL